jgi:hypothetical protein
MIKIVFNKIEKHFEMGVSDFPSHLFPAFSDLIQKDHGVIGGDIIKILITELPTELGKNPMGVYGNVLLRFPYFSSPVEELCGLSSDILLEKDLDHPADIMPLFERHAGSNTVNAF